MSGVFSSTVFSSSVYNTGGTPPAPSGMPLGGGMFAWAEDTSAADRERELAEIRKTLAMEDTLLEIV
jgi:hypothetical protein